MKPHEFILNLIFPRRCPICDRPVRPFGALVCRECARRVRYVHDPTCYKCGKPLEDDAAEYCDDCARHHHIYDRGWALFEYPTISHSIAYFKYHGRREYADWYGERLYARYGRLLNAMRPDVLIPVPIHASKLRTRGYNQAALIARSLGAYAHIPVREDIVVRARATRPLKDYAPAERNNILRGAFKIAANDVKLKTIMIIDDIYTTGSTVDEVAAVCRAAGAERVYVLTLAIGSGV